MSEHLNAKIGGVPNTKIHIRNIPPHITETHLRSILGNVAYIKDLCYFNKNKKQMNMYPNSKVYNTALITFNTHEEAVNILQNIQNLIDSSGEDKPIEAKFAIPSNVINNNNNNNSNNNNNMNSGNLFSRNNYGLPYQNNNTNNTSNNNNMNNFSDNFNDSGNNNANNSSNNNNNNGGNYVNGENSMTNENGAVAGTNNSNFLSRGVRQRNNNNSNSNTVGGIGNKQMNALNSNGMNANNYNMFMKYNNNNRKNDSVQGMGAENETNNINSGGRQQSYQPNCFQSNGGNNSNNNGMNNNNNNTNNMSNMTNVNPVNNNGTSTSNNVGLYAGGDSFLWDNENEKNVDGLSLWESYKDSNNNVYYYNNLTKHSQWKKPIHPSKLFQYNSMEKVKQNGPQGSNLFIFHIPSEWNDVDLFEHFCCFGNIISSKIQRDSTGRNSGFGFVSYDNTVSAQRAIQHMNGYFVNNKYLKVQLKKGEVANEAQA